MSSPETTDATKPSLAQDWRSFLRYWLRGRNGMIVLLVVAVVVGALNWSWLVAVGIAPLLIAVLPCAAMCALGLCMNRMAGGSCSTESSPVGTPKPDARAMASLKARERGPAPLPSAGSTPLAPPSAGRAISSTDPSKPEERS
jgi:hypothetical protein